MTLKVGTMYGPENWQTAAMESFTDGVTEATDGKITFEYFYGDSLLGSDELAGGLKDGIIDFATFVPVYTPAAFPMDEWASSLAYMADNSPVAGALQGAAATMEWAFETDEYMDELTSQGITPLVPRLLAHHKYGILCSSENSTLDEVQGKRARVGSAAATGEAEMLSMVPTSVTGAETYSAFQQGVLDCSWTQPPDMMALSLQDHAKYYNAAGLMGFSSMVLGMSANTWDRLPQEAKDAIWGEIPAYLEAMITGNFEQNIKALDLEGMNYVVPDEAMSQKIADYHAGLDEQLVESAPGVIADPGATLGAMEANHKEWLTSAVDELGYPADAQSWADHVETNGKDIPDLQPWLDAVTEKILAPNMPS
ncbi:MAG: hypothetical protein ACQEXN_12220 [Actinomycetota bacterium]